MDVSFCLFVAIAIVVVAAVIIVSYRQDQKRIADMRAVAARIGWQYAPEEAGLDGVLAGFGLFSRGHARKARNVLAARVDSAAAKIVDYRYELGYGNNRRIHLQTVLLLESDRLELPIFALRPEGVSQRLADLFGQQDIDFPDHPGFSADYVLQGADEQQVRALFNSERLAFFARRPGLCLEGHGHRLIYYRAKQLVSPGAIPSFLEEGLAVLRLLAGEGRPAPAAEPDPLAGLDEVLAELGVEEGPAPGGSPAP